MVTINLPKTFQNYDNFFQNYIRDTILQDIQSTLFSECSTKSIYKFGLSGCLFVCIQ